MVALTLANWPRDTIVRVRNADSGKNNTS